jgi:hypothetical protein
MGRDHHDHRRNNLPRPPVPSKTLLESTEVNR